MFWAIFFTNSSGRPWEDLLRYKYIHSEGYLNAKVKSNCFSLKLTTALNGSAPEGVSFKRGQTNLQFAPINYSHSLKNPLKKLPSDQGCQIFIGATYQNGEKYTKLPPNIPYVHKIYQMGLK
jgi:hypothetical protein